MLINVSTRRFGRAVRLPERDIAAPPGAGLSKSAVPRRFVALSAERMHAWITADLSQLDLLAIQIDGMHVSHELTLLAAVGIDREGTKHPLGLLEGATENVAVVQALLDKLIEGGLDPNIWRLFVVDRPKALIKAIRRTFGGHTPRSARKSRLRFSPLDALHRMPSAPVRSQRCQVHKARNNVERLPKHLRASVRAALRQAWELDDADNVERLVRNLACRLEQVAPGVAASILEGLDEALTVIRLGLLLSLRPSLACTNIIENMMGAIPRVCRNVKHWRDAPMALRWTAAAVREVAKGFRGLKACKQLPLLRAALAAHHSNHQHVTAHAPNALAV